MSLKVSIITVVLNNKNYIESCVKSVQSQSHDNIEHIIVDGGSTDGTLEILNHYSGKISKLISEKDNGIYYALNKGISLATGEIIGILHADDVYNNDSVIEKVVNVFNKENVDSIYGDLVYVERNRLDRVLRYWKAGDFSISKLKNGWFPPHPTIFLKKSIYLRYGFYDVSLKIASDYDLILRLFLRKMISVYYLPEVFIKMRNGGLSNRNVICLIRKSIEDFSVLRKNVIRFPFFVLLMKNLLKVPQFFK